jgi:AraC-like DNA-binding protein
MAYQTYKPSLELSGLIKCYWRLESPTEENPEKQTIVPDGCMEMIFHYGDLYKQYLQNAKNIIQPKCFLIGQLTRPLKIEPTGQTGIFSIRFHPNGFSSFTSIPIKEMENTATSLEKIWGKDGKEIGKKVLSANSVSERIKYIESFLLNRLPNIETIDHVIKSTVDTILTANGHLSVNDLSKLINISRRQLERKFSSFIGLSPKQLSKTIRFQTTLKMLLNKQFVSLTTLAYEGEYYDQAHFIKDFIEFTGLTPNNFYGNNLKMSLLFYGME